MVEYKLNLACGNDYRESTSKEKWVNVDLSSGVKADKYFDAFVIPYPFKDETFDMVLANDFLEHIPHVVFDKSGRYITGEGLTNVLAEIWRILKPDGRLDARFPHEDSRNNIIDPTHTRRLTRETFEWYYTDGGRYGFYSDRHFEVVEYHHSPNKGNDRVILRKIGGKASGGD